MSLADTQAHKANGPANGLIPGITFPQKTQGEETASDSISNSFDGPQVNGQPTTVTKFSPPQLADSPFFSPLCAVINAAFHEQRSEGGLIYAPTHFKRLQTDGQLLDELSNAPGTFTYILHYSGTTDVIATASGKRYMGEVVTVGDVEIPKTRSMWKRVGAVPEGTEAWELSTMAVDPKLQRRGLAGYLMKITEDEIKRRFQAMHGVGSQMRLVLMLTTVKEIHFAFYAKRGFKKDYEMWFEKEHLGGDAGFSVIHMSKEVDVRELKK
ncbi:hypothetical protein LTR37_000273 [Vermiconidia calcicola]|uniref:Uncharacterized protein n=1 Tax=Vermiconidia calcicola TaxID=1690605 RepID=A0ACC3P1D7_9PEZI|nr:hypothetical protein LTR37_000273 [Vermiconidia calcicola]